MRILSYLIPWAHWFHLMPYPKRFWWSPEIRSVYITFYEWYEKRVITYHKKSLSQIDTGFGLQEASIELVRRRRIAEANGIDPLDPRYPDIFDILEESDSL